MCKFYGYTRVSTTTQAEKGYGLDVQEKAIRAYAAEHGIEIERVFTDKGISGTTESRPELDELLTETLKKGDCIIVHNTSRLWRDIFAQATIMKAVMNEGANIISIDDPEFDIYKYMTDPNNFMITGMMGMLDQWERLTIARKLARGRDTKAAQGAKPAGLCPFGYKFADDKKSVVIELGEAATIRLIFSEAQKGESLGKIAATLNGKEIPTRSGKAWSRGTIQNILRNDFYTGILTHKGEKIEGTHEPIISRVQFGKVAAQLSRKDKHSRGEA